MIFVILFKMFLVLILTAFKAYWIGNVLRVLEKGFFTVLSWHFSWHFSWYFSRYFSRLYWIAPQVKEGSKFDVLLTYPFFGNEIGFYLAHWLKVNNAKPRKNPWSKPAACHQPKKVRPIKWLDFELNLANLDGFWRDSAVQIGQVHPGPPVPPFFRLKPSKLARFNSK